MRFQLAMLLAIPWLLIPAVSNAQIDELTAKEIAADYVREMTDSQASRPLRVSRREDWEDELFDTQLRSKGQIAKAAYFFEVTTDGNFVLSPDEAITVLSIDGELRWVVSVAADSGEPFGLYGTPDPELGFQRLVLHSRLRIQSEAEAKTFAYLFFTTIHDPIDTQIVDTARHLRRKVEDHYYSVAGAKAERIATKWWRHFKKSTMPVPWRISASRMDDGTGFDMSVTYLGRAQQFWALHIAVKTNGEFEVIGNELIFELP